MPTYLYLCPKHNEFEYEHSIKNKLEYCPFCKENGNDQEVIRLIPPNTGFILNGSGWARDNYK